LSLADRDLPRLKRFCLWQRELKNSFPQFGLDFVDIDRAGVLEHEFINAIVGFPMEARPAFRLLPIPTAQNADLVVLARDLQIFFRHPGEIDGKAVSLGRFVGFENRFYGVAEVRRSAVGIVDGSSAE